MKIELNEDELTLIVRALYQYMRRAISHRDAIWYRQGSEKKPVPTANIETKAS